MTALWCQQLAAMAARQAAEEWTAAQATRLGLSRKSVLGAVVRGWAPEEIEAADNIAGLPPGRGSDDG